MNYFISKLIFQRCKSTIPIHRIYVRWASSSSTPRVINPGEYENENERIEQKSTNSHTETSNSDFVQDDKTATASGVNINWKFNAQDPNEDDVAQSEQVAKPRKAKPMLKKTIRATDMLETVIDPNGKFIYTKMKNNDSRIGQLLTNIKSKKYAMKRDLVMLEGRRLVQDALLAGCTLKYLLFSRKQDVESIQSALPRIGAKIYKMPLREMQMWSELTTCPGIMGLFRTPKTEKYENEFPALPLTIYCDNIREPGNLGGILRVAASVSCRTIKLSTGCTHLWDSKVIRGAAGAHFRMQIQANQNVDHLREILNNPDTPSKLFIADSNMVHDETKKNANDDADRIAELINQIPVVPYYSMDLKQVQNHGEDIIFVIGGETTGLSADIYQLAKEFNGVRLNIPMSNGIDSLNSATALGIIVFEIYKAYNAKL